MEQKSKHRIAYAIRIVGATASLAVMWQAVRFWQGDINSTPIEGVAAVLGVMSTPVAADLNSFTGFIRFISGGALWILCGPISLAATECLSRAVEVGFLQFKAELKEAFLENERMERVRADRERRYEARRRRRCCRCDC